MYSIVQVVINGVNKLLLPLSTTYYLMVATGAFQRLCSDKSTHPRTLKQRAVLDSIDLIGSLASFRWHLSLAKRTLTTSKGT